MKPGNLVRITRASIGVPLDSLGLIIEKRGARGSRDRIQLYVVRLVGGNGKAGRVRRYLARDLRRV